MKSVAYFVKEHSVVRLIWSKSDTILLIFAGASAEFALSKAVDWLYFTGRLPQDPIGRLFSTVAYARAIVFSETETAIMAIDAMTSIHKAVEEKRKATIPDWAYRDVLFMLIDYSIRAFELLERKMTLTEKEEVFDTFLRVGTRMKLPGLPQTLTDWELVRADHLSNHLQYSSYTSDLFKQYRKHLGAVRYRILLEAQILVVPSVVKESLGFRKKSRLQLVLGFYKTIKRLKADGFLKSLLIPSQFRKQVAMLDV